MQSYLLNLCHSNSLKMEGVQIVHDPTKPTSPKFKRNIPSVCCNRTDDSCRWPQNDSIRNEPPQKPGLRRDCDFAYSSAQTKLSRFNVAKFHNERIISKSTQLIDLPELDWSRTNIKIQSRSEDEYNSFKQNSEKSSSNHKRDLLYWNKDQKMNQPEMRSTSALSIEYPVLECSRTIIKIRSRTEEACNTYKKNPEESSSSNDRNVLYLKSDQKMNQTKLRSNRWIADNSVRNNIPRLPCRREAVTEAE